VIVIGLTGSIGMGKSTTAALFAEAGVPVFDSDVEVALLYGPGGAAVAGVEKAFPGVVHDGMVDRNLLGERVLHDPDALRNLTQTIVYPLLQERRQDFFDAAETAGAEVVLLDAPMLFESGGDKMVDVVVVATAPANLQRERVLARPGMTQAKFEAVLARQLPDAEKRKRADFIVDTSQGIEAARKQVGEIIATLRAKAVGRDSGPA
jgi:dephospho-CoA kinase